MSVRKAICADSLSLLIPIGVPTRNIVPYGESGSGHRFNEAVAQAEASVCAIVVLNASGPTWA